MKYVHPEIETIFDTENGCYNTLVIEEQRFFVRLLEDIYQQLQGMNGESVISVKDGPVNFAKNGILLDNFVPFNLNRKPIISLMIADMDRRAAAPEHFDRTASALAAVEMWLNDLAYDYSCDIVFPNISIATLLKAACPEIRGEDTSIAERVLDYMELIEEFDHRRLFFTLNMRSYVADEEMDVFARSVVSHGYPVIAIEAHAYPILSTEKRVVIDSDLCEIS